LFGRRPDATLVRDLSPTRRFMPLLSPRRNENLVWFELDVPVERALAFAEEKSARRAPGRPLTLFHVILAALAKILHERPRLNRFTAGGRLWQRDGIWLTFSAKQRFDDDAPLLTVKRRVDPTQPIEAMVDALLDSLERGRRGERTTSDREVAGLLRLPPFLARAAIALAGLADSFGLLPRAMIDSDPLYASVFVANLGSVGLEAGHHHLWQHGNCPIFCVIGRVKPGADGGRKATLKFTYDERIEDGLYCARSLDRLRELIEHPEKLDAA
jgi:hypothetical protein